MAEHKSDEQIIRSTHNTARFFTETRHVSWVLLIAAVLKQPSSTDPAV